MSIHPFDGVWDDLEMWGRWGRQDDGRPDPEAGSGSIYDMGPSLDPRIVEAPPDAPTPFIDASRCEELDRMIMQLGHKHRERIRAYFYKRFWLPHALIAESVRMLVDVGGT